MTKSPPASEGKTGESHHHAARETIESVVVAVILAFLLRSFLVEPFVIPTGSMAPTLQGRHKDVICEKCEYQYRTGASSENEENERFRRRTVVATVCPICRYRMVTRPDLDPNQRTFNGDRIVVSKYEYDLKQPRRWDIIVFKFPGNATQNYIKRLVGLPNETVRIQQGDIFVKQEGGEDFQIARKPPDRQLVMLQLVDDSRHVADELADAGWPARWRAWSASGSAGDQATQVLDGGRRYTITAPRDQPVWLRYHHHVPSLDDWQMVLAGQRPAGIDQRQGQLISDFYAYNSGISVSEGSRYDPTTAPEQYPGDIRIGSDTKLSQGDSSESWGLHWVGDLAFEADIDVQGDEGFLLLNLVEGGLHHKCRINVATGEASLQIDGQATWSDTPASDHVPLHGESAGGQSEKRVPHVTAMTALRGAGKYAIRFLNVDDQLRLWVNNRLVEFDGATTFTAQANQVPKWSPQDPGDLAPIGVGAVGLSLELQRLRVLRDVYYLALSRHPQLGQDTGYDDSDYDLPAYHQEILDVLASPEEWATTSLFQSRRAVQFDLRDGQYFPLGDNSPQSADARSWPAPPYVERDMLLGRAILIYWPHAWNRPVPFTPNLERMGVIR